MNWYTKLFFILVFNLIAVAGFSQKGQSIEKREKELLKKEEQRKAEDAAAIEEGKKNHMKIQTRETKKRMRKSRKKANKVNHNKGGFFLIRLLRH